MALVASHQVHRVASKGSQQFALIMSSQSRRCCTGPTAATPAPAREALPTYPVQSTGHFPFRASGEAEALEDCRSSKVGWATDEFSNIGSWVMESTRRPQTEDVDAYLAGIVQNRESKVNYQELAHQELRPLVPWDMRWLPGMFSSECICIRTDRPDTCTERISKNEYQYSRRTPEICRGTLNRPSAEQSSTLTVRGLERWSS